MMHKLISTFLFVLSLFKNYDFKNLGTDFSMTNCGLRNFNEKGFQNNIEGEAEFGEFPWMAAILKINITIDFITDIYQCGGTLISSKMVLTAAHCVNKLDAKSLKIRAGEWDTQSTDEPFPFTEHYVQNIIIHEEFNNTNLKNDIALLKLKEDVKFAQHISTICLPPLEHDYNGKRCFVSGWGKDHFGKEGMYQYILKKIEVPTINFLECQNILRKKRMGKRFVLDSSFMCAGGESEIDACKGDGGSPLMCPFNNSTNRYYQAGIVAWGIKCGDSGVPGVYVNVAKFQTWIASKLN